MYIGDEFFLGLGLAVLYYFFIHPIYKNATDDWKDDELAMLLEFPFFIISMFGMAYILGTIFNYIGKLF